MDCWLFDHQLRHEVFRLVRLTAAHAETALADALVADVEAGPPGSEDQGYESLTP